MLGDNKARILRDAEKYVIHGKILQAINEYLKIVKADPHDVLTLNTVGDLYLRLGNVPEATKYFSQVAESYTRNNFLLKAIAVYKKILNADPENREINQTLATLMARQGLHVDARNQYLRVAELLSREGKTRESVAAYEKVVELDPMSTAVQLKLAQIHQSEGNKERAHSYFTGAARAQAKAGKYQEAVKSYERAMEIDPVNTVALRGFLDTCIQLGDVSAVLEQLKKSLALQHDNVALLELLGHAYIASGQVENALKTFEQVVSHDDGRYPLFFTVSNAYVQAGNYDQACSCLDTILPVLITRRDTERAVEAYNQALKASPDNVLALTKLAEVFSATNDQLRYLGTLERLANVYRAAQRPEEALRKIEAALQVSPDNERFLKLHHEMFIEAFPGTPYAPPAQQEVQSGYSPGVEEAKGAEGSNILEIDLLINYGMREKALGLLTAMEARDPMDREVRVRLLSLFRDSGQSVKAAEQCLALSAIYRSLRNEDEATKYLSEARRLAPDLAGPRLDLAAFAAERGITLEAAPAVSSARPSEAPGGMELDLSGDLSEIFFKDAPGAPAPDEAAEVPYGGAQIVEEYSPTVEKSPPSDSIQEQLQEVDFYIRLGFHDEAKAKLEELAHDFPQHPELALRYRQLAGESAQEEELPIALGPPEPEAIGQAEDKPASGGEKLFQDLKIDLAMEPFEMDLGSKGSETADSQEYLIGTSPERERELRMQASRPAEDEAAEAKSNEMFADLLEEVKAITDQEIAREDFETHFNLGIAYREMDLTDDAIKEFQIAFKTLNAAASPKEVVQCCGMLSTCFLEKGMPRSTIRWCQTGLEVPEISSHEAMALRYDMGMAYSQIGESERALECFGAIFGIDPSYRDVAQRIDDLKGRS